MSNGGRNALVDDNAPQPNIAGVKGGGNAHHHAGQARVSQRRRCASWRGGPPAGAWGARQVAPCWRWASAGSPAAAAAVAAAALL